MGRVLPAKTASAAAAQAPSAMDPQSLHRRDGHKNFFINSSYRSCWRASDGPQVLWVDCLPQQKTFEEIRN